MALDTSFSPAPAGDPARDLRGLLAELSLQDKVRLVVGASMWTTAAVPSIGLRSMVLSDGPAGVRGVTEDASETAASFPAPSALSATWDTELAARTGALFAAEARRHGVDVVLAPQVNLQRTPVGGRHFECFSEDPLLTAAIAVPLVRAAQDRGVGMCVKHFVANDSETDRTTYQARVDERTLREVYLAPFEALVRAGAWSVMGAYSGVDDGSCAAPMLEHRPLLTGVLKDEWGFDGVVVSDWVATTSVAPAVRGGLDLQMPGPDGPWGDGLAAAVRAGEVTEAELDEKVLRLLRLAVRVGALGDAGPAAALAAAQRPGRHEVARALRELVARSLVVLRDDDALLPLDPNRTASIALIGPNAQHPFNQGGGSSMVRPDRVATLPDALAAAFPAATIEAHVGASSRMFPPPLDLGRGLAPDGSAGALFELLAADGTVLAARRGTAWDGWLREVSADAVALRIRTELDLPEPGEHTVGVGTVGRHRVLLGDVPVSASEHVVGAEVILDSTYNNPAPVTAVVSGPARVTLDVTVQAVHPVGYDSFVRAALVHRLPGPSAAQLRAPAVAAAAAADVAIVVIGTTEEVESEGWDRATLDLPGDQDELVRAVLAANPRTVVVVNAGAPVLLPWLDDAPCVVWGWLGGQEWPDALADALAGIVEPSGRLPWTLPARADDVPVPHAVPVDGVVAYTEGVHVGHRSWDLLGRTPAAPFGHGLGWTTWAYDDLTVAATPDGGAELRLTVTNTGPRTGREVVQVYVEPPTGTPVGDRPVRWLGAFTVVPAAPGVPTTVRIRLAPEALRVWDTERAGWVTPPGTYPIRVGRSSRDLRLTAHLTVPPREHQSLHPPQ